VQARDVRWRALLCVLEKSHHRQRERFFWLNARPQISQRPQMRRPCDPVWL
jgi:hypothetical protein